MANLKPLPIVDIRDWRYVRKKRKKCDLNNSRSSDEEIELKNSFQPLSEETREEKEDMDLSESVQEVKKVKVPPVVIYSNLQNHNTAMKELRSELSEDISLNCKRNRTIIYTKNLADYKIVCEKMCVAEVPYHTYTPQSEKPIFSILKGLASNVSELEVKSDLLEKNLKVIDVKQFIKKETDEDGKPFSRKLPIFSVQFEKDTLREDIKKVRIVCFCKVTWEPSRSKSTIVQCYKCQQFGHIAKNCFKQAQCAICAEEHNTRDCKNSEKLTCTNCGENHRADDPDCNYYKRASKKKSSNNRNQFGGTHIQQVYENSGRRKNLSTNVTQQQKEEPSYSQAARGREGKNDGNYNDYGQNHNNKREQTNEESFASAWKEIKNIFKDINFGKIMKVFKSTVHNIKQCNDGMSKFSCLVEGIIEMFD